MVVFKNKKYLLILSLFFFLSFFGKVDAAMLYFSPASGNQTTGNVMNVNVLVNTQGQAINSADAVITYPASFLEVISISKSGSTFSLWVEEPTFSNNSGTIRLSGGLPTPGYNGTAGKIVGITFRIKAPGSASLVFSSGAVRANDGYGTDVLSSLGTATYAISSAPVPPPKPAPVIEEPPVVEIPPPMPYTPPEPVKVVAEEGWFEKIFNYLDSLNVSGSFLTLMALILLLTALLMYGRSRFVHLRSKVRRETYDVEKVLHHSFDTLKEDITACVGLLERAKHHRSLTEEERAVVSLLKQHLRQTETLVTREIHDIRRKTEE